MASIFNEQRVLGARVVSDGTLLFNQQPVIGVRVEASATFIGSQRVLGVDVLPSDRPIYNDQPVRGVVVIGDARKLYNGRLVIPVRDLQGGMGGSPVRADSTTKTADTAQITADNAK